MNIPIAEQRRQDLELVRAILAGSQEAWEQFVKKYAALILAVSRRFFRDQDDVNEVFVSVLEGLYHHKLATFAGNSRLSTWLVVVTRNAAADRLRQRFGRRGVPRGLRGLSPLDREIFRLFYVEGLDCETVRHWAPRGSAPLTTAELCGALRRIEERLDDRILERIAHDLFASSVGALSDRMLEFLDLEDLEARAAGHEREPDHVAYQLEARETAKAVQAALDQLPEQERRILLLRYDQGWTARQIAAELGLRGEQRVYTLIRRGQRKLSQILGKDS